MPTKIQKHGSGCDLVNKSTICWKKKKMQSESLMLKVMKSGVTINLNILGLFMKDKVVSNLNSTLVVTIHLSRRRKKNNYNKNTNIPHLCNRSKSRLIIHTIEVVNVPNLQYQSYAKWKVPQL